MKKILLFVFAFFAAVLIVSCSDESEETNELGGSCAVEGEESCSGDNSQILVCSSSSWQAKKTCNINFGQYCRQTASGAYSCTDSGSSSNSGDSGNNNNNNDNNSDSNSNNNDSTDSNQNDNDSTEPEPNDNDQDNNTDPADDADSNDTEPNNDSDTTDPTPNDNDNDQQENPQSTLPAPGDCANIINCMDSCGENDSTCQQNCYNNGTTAGKNQFSAWQTCNENNSCEYYYDCLWENCRDEEAICGLAGDTVNYKIPYGKATIHGTFTYLHDENEEDVFISNCVEGGFVTGSFGNNFNLIDSSKTPLAYAKLLSNPNDSTDKYIVLFQGHNDTTTDKPVVRMFIKATTSGSYVFGLGDFSTEKIRLYITENDGSCDHAFGYGAVTISAISYTPGNTTITVDDVVDLYSYKAMPYYGGNIADGEDLIACQPK